MSSHIVSFYTTDAPDLLGRTYNDMMAYSFDVMEGCHDYVQWLFPTAEKSKFSRTAPVLTADDTMVLRASKAAQTRLISAVKKFLEFLNWMDYPCDHNILRITRIIRSLRLFGLESEAKSFFNHIVHCYEQAELAETTMTFWKTALSEDPMESLRDVVERQT